MMKGRAGKGGGKVAAKGDKGGGKVSEAGVVAAATSGVWV